MLTTSRNCHMSIIMGPNIDEDLLLRELRKTSEVIRSFSPGFAPFAPVCETTAVLATVTAGADWCF